MYPVAFPLPLPVPPPDRPAYIRNRPSCDGCGCSDLAHGDRAVRACDGDSPLPVGSGLSIHCPYVSQASMCLCTGWQEPSLN